MIFIDVAETSVGFTKIYLVWKLVCNPKCTQVVNDAEWMIYVNRLRVQIRWVFGLSFPRIPRSVRWKMVNVEAVVGKGWWILIIVKGKHLNERTPKMMSWKVKSDSLSEIDCLHSTYEAKSLFGVTISSWFFWFGVRSCVRLSFVHFLKEKLNFVTAKGHQANGICWQTDSVTAINDDAFGFAESIEKPSSSNFKACR